MKIKKMLLENFAGIYAGTHKTKIEVDFEKNENPIIVLSGANGCGKTTFMSLCHPLRGTFDDRDDIILEGEIGHSICILEKDGIEYKTEHFYGKSKNKSFISKDGIELNENGNIKSFNTIAFEELSIDKEYFKLGRIGSNVTNFINLSVTERKKFMNHFIPDIQDILDASANVNDKYRLITQEIKVLKADISKYKDIDELNSEKEELSKNLEKKNKKILKLQMEQQKNKTTSELIEKDIFDIIDKEDIIGENFDEKLINFENYEYELQNNLLNANNKLSKITDKFPNLKNYKEEDILSHINTLNVDQETLQINIKKNNEDLVELEKDSVDNENKIFSYTNKLNNIKEVDFDQLDIIKESLTENEKSLKRITNVIEKFKENDLYDEEYFSEKFITSAKYIQDKNDISNFASNIAEIKSEFNEEEINAVINNIDTDNLDSLSNKLENYKTNLQSLENDLNKLNNESSFFKKSIDKRPFDCRIDSCSYISQAVKFFESYEEKSKKLSDDIESMESKINKLENEYEFLSNCHNLKNAYVKYYNKIRNISKYITCNFIYSKPYSYLNTSNINSLIDDTNNVFDMIDSFQLYYSLSKENITLSNSLELIVNNKDLFEVYNSEIEKLNKSNEKIEKKILKLNEENKAFSDKYDTLRKKYVIFENLLECYQIKDENEKDYNRVLAIYETIKEKTKSNKKLKDTIDGLENEIKEQQDDSELLSKKLEDVKNSIFSLTHNLNRLEEINLDYEDLCEVKKALDSKTGLPLIFIDNYLKSIQIKANELLDVAYDGKFKIKFNVTSTEFNIEVFKSDGTYLKDISLASQGETSLTNSSLSLAMLEKMIKGYNIVYLDEIDATLSTENRRLFIDLLKKQMKDLNIEQLFIITHNNAFYNQNVDLILFKGHDCPSKKDKYFYEGKNVLLEIK